MTTHRFGRVEKQRRMKLYEGVFSILNQQDSNCCFPGIMGSLLMPLEDLGRLSELSYEWFEEYLPNSCCSPYPIRLLADGSVRDWEDAF